MLRRLSDYFSQVIEEFKKIKYPERREIVTTSIGVLTTVLVVGFFCMSIDWLFITFINLAIF